MPNARDLDVLCSLRCLEAWNSSPYSDHGSEIWSERTRKGRFTSNCVTCRACGIVVHRPADCVLHESTCPDRQWLLGLSALDFTEFAGREVGFTDEDWEAAVLIAERHPHWNGAEIALVVIEERL